jgi:hypothetical protein
MLRDSDSTMPLWLVHPLSACALLALVFISFLMIGRKIARGNRTVADDREAVLCDEDLTAPRRRFRDNSLPELSPYRVQQYLEAVYTGPDAVDYTTTPGYVA